MNLISLGSVIVENYGRKDQGKLSKKTLFHLTVLKLIISPLVTALFLYIVVVVFSIRLDPVLIFVHLIT